MRQYLRRPIGQLANAWFTDRQSAGNPQALLWVELWACKPSWPPSHVSRPRDCSGVSQTQVPVPLSSQIQVQEQVNYLCFVCLILGR